LLSNSGRLRRRDEVMARLTAAIASRVRDDLGAALDAAGVPQGPIRAVDEVLMSEHTAARELVERFTHPQIGEFPALRVPLKFDGWDDPTVHRPPLLGEHTESVLSERLGLSRERIAQLKEAKAI
jgi:crotonobetainyl-CoA:carnitine CoA-transferase CaiB-like acyl-CoA transferase